MISNLVSARALIQADLDHALLSWLYGPIRYPN
jgi:hypothetical protein